jgi:hypothetical protein
MSVGNRLLAVSLSRNVRSAYKSCLGSNIFPNAGGLLMRRVSFVLMILAVAGTSSVRGQQPEARKALRDGDFGDRQSVREERREGHQEGRDDRQEARETRRDERREARGDRGDDHELLRLALIAALRDGDFGDRQSVREERREGRQEGRDDRQEARETRRGERQESRRDGGSD